MKYVLLFSSIPYKREKNSKLCLTKNLSLPKIMATAVGFTVCQGHTVKKEAAYSLDKKCQIK